MALNWSTVTAKDVKQACEELAAQGGDKKTGLIVICAGRSLPAKAVLRLAYRRANGLSETAKIQFSSGEATLRILDSLGFEVARRLAESASGVKHVVQS